MKLFLCLFNFVENTLTGLCFSKAFFIFKSTIHRCVLTSPFFPPYLFYPAVFGKNICFFLLFSPPVKLPLSGMPFFRLTIFSIQTQTARKRGFKCGDEVALIAKVGSQPTHVGFGTLVTQACSDSVCRLLHGITVTSNTSINEFVISIGCNHCE